jgi:hypothetical protein
MLPSADLGARAARRLAALPLLAALLASCATSAATDPSTGAPVEAPTEAADTKAPEAAPTATPQAAPPAFQGPEPPDGKWLVDEKGREYFPYEIPKYEGHYIYLEDGRIQIDFGTILEVVEDRDESFVVKIFRMTQAPRPAVVRPDPEAIAATYQPQVEGEIDRLRFVPFGEGLPTSGQWRQGFEIVDFNRDGHLDIVHGPPRKGTPTLRAFFGDGKGRWSAWAGRPTGAPLDYGDVAVADFDGDGHLDVALAVHLHGLRVLRSDGKGGFADWGRGLEYVVAGGDQQIPDFTSRTLVAVDWNRDGRSDLIAIGEGPTLAIGGQGGNPEFRRGAQGAVVFLNQGDGSWQRMDEGTGKQQVHADDLELVDLDRDGLTDFVTAANISGYRSILHYGQPDGSWRLAEVPGVRPGVVSAVASDDFDGDGAPDLVLGYAAAEAGAQRSGVDLHLQRPGGEWERVAVYSEDGNSGVWAVDTGDLDGDGATDVVALFGDGRRLVLRGTGDGGLIGETSPELAPSQPGCRGYEVELVDLDGDGRDEVVMGFAGERGSEQLFLPNAPPVCPHQGSLEAWKAMPVDSPSGG